MGAADVVGVLLGDLLDVDAAHVAEQHHRALGAAVPEDRRVVLLLDLGLRVDEDADRHVAADLEVEDRERVLGGLLGRVGELDAARLHPAAGQDLRLDRRPVRRSRSAACFASSAVVQKPYLVTGIPARSTMRRDSYS